MLRTDANVIKVDSSPNQNQLRLDTDISLPNMKNKEKVIESKNTYTSKVQTTQVELQGKIAYQEETCRVCLEKPHDTVLFPCGHCNICFLCCLKLLRISDVCPLCRSQALEIYRINISSTIYNIVEITEVVDQGNIGMYIELLEYIDSLNKQ